MSGWGIAETAPKIEKIKAESADYLNGLNSCGAIDWGNYDYAFDFYADLIQEAYELGKAEAEPHWIPVTEGLPEERDWYLGIFKESDTGWINPIPFICDYLLGKKTKATTKEGWILKGLTDGDEYIDYYFNLECVAWMPLPEPYKEVTE